jgi:hypothetical protein
MHELLALITDGQYGEPIVRIDYQPDQAKLVVWHETIRLFIFINELVDHKASVYHFAVLSIIDI